MRRSDVPTPALLFEHRHLDRNIALMRDGAAQLGIKLRPMQELTKVDLGGAFCVMRGDDVIDVWPTRACH
jgi:D-serine deaminase-like pyridoxal phosphate-dependent protein